MMNAPDIDRSDAVPVIRSLGNGFTKHVLLPICTDLAAEEFMPNLSRLRTFLPEHVARGAECAVLAPQGRRKKLHLLRQWQADERIEYGDLYLLETDEGRIFRVVEPGSEEFVSLRPYGAHTPGILVDWTTIGRAWHVCVMLDYMDSTDETE